MTTTAELFYMAWWCFVICVKLNRTAVDAPVYVVLSTMNSCYECFVYLSAAPPSYPSEVRVFSGSESATIMWEMPGFVQSFFGKVYQNK